MKEEKKLKYIIRKIKEIKIKFEAVVLGEGVNAFRLGIATTKCDDFYYEPRRFNKDFIITFYAKSEEEAREKMKDFENKYWNDY